MTGMNLQPVSEVPSIRVKAYDCASEYDLKAARDMITRDFPQARLLQLDPLLVQIGDSPAVAIFDYGAVVFFDLETAEIQHWLDKLKTCASRENKIICEDDFLLNLSFQQMSPVGTEEWHIKEFNRDIALLVSIVLSRSVSLEYYERLVGDAMEQLEQTVNFMADRGRIQRRSRDLTRRVGFALAVEHALAYNVLVLEDPDVVWDGGKDAEELYLALRREFDLEDRVKIIREKVSIIARSSTFIISRLEAQRSQLLEWGIILLIVGEIVLVLLGKF